MGGGRWDVEKAGRDNCKVAGHDNDESEWKGEDEHGEHDDDESEWKGEDEHGEHDEGDGDLHATGGARGERAVRVQLRLRSPMRRGRTLCNGANMVERAYTVTTLFSIVHHQLRRLENCETIVFSTREDNFLSRGGAATPFGANE